MGVVDVGGVAGAAGVRVGGERVPGLFVGEQAVQFGHVVGFGVDDRHTGGAQPGLGLGDLHRSDRVVTVLHGLHAEVNDFDLHVAVDPDVDRTSGAISVFGHEDGVAQLGEPHHLLKELGAGLAHAAAA
ncbi:hypothetical protein ACQPYE_27735 [Actinosynnema sp. CA-299493]